MVIATGSQCCRTASSSVRRQGDLLDRRLALTEVPGRLVVVGAGYIGLELGTAFAKMGAAVTVVEAQSRILPQYDAELTRPVAEAPARTRRRGDHGRQGNGFARNGTRLPSRRRMGRA